MKKTLSNQMTILMISILGVCFISCSKDDASGVIETGGVLNVNVEKAGSFESLLGKSMKYNTEKLKITGSLNGDDIRCLRDMMNTNKGGKLKSLDMADAYIVAGGGWYYEDEYANPEIWEPGDSMYVTKPNTIGEYMFENCDALENLILPNSVVKLSHYMFGYESLSEIRSITIGRSTIGTTDIPHEDCDIPDMLIWLYNLEEINVHADNPKYASENGIMYNKGKTVLYNVPANYKYGKFSFPNTLKVIAHEAFRDYHASSSIKLPASIQKIEYRAFVQSKFKIIDIGSVSEIESGVFSDCEEVESITLSESLTMIPSSTFCECKLLSSITIPSSVRLVAGGIFAGCLNLHSIYMESSNPPTGTSYVKNARDIFNNYYYEDWYKSIKLYVPTGSKSKYSSTVPWNELIIIER